MFKIGDSTVSRLQSVASVWHPCNTQRPTEQHVKVEVDQVHFALRNDRAEGFGWPRLTCSAPSEKLPPPSMTLLQIFRNALSTVAAACRRGLTRLPAAF